MVSIIGKFLVLRRLSIVSSLKELAQLNPNEVYDVLHSLRSSGIIEDLQSRAHKRNRRALKQLLTINSQLSTIYILSRIECNSSRGTRHNWQNVMDLCSEICKFQGRIDTGEFRRRAC